MQNIVTMDFAAQRVKMAWLWGHHDHFLYLLLSIVCVANIVMGVLYELPNLQ